MTGVGNNRCPFIISPRGHDERTQGHRQPPPDKPAGDPPGEEHDSGQCDGVNDGPHDELLCRHEPPPPNSGLVWPTSHPRTPRGSQPSVRLPSGAGGACGVGVSRLWGSAPAACARRRVRRRRARGGLGLIATVRQQVLRVRRDPDVGQERTRATVTPCHARVGPTTPNLIVRSAFGRSDRRAQRPGSCGEIASSLSCHPTKKSERRNDRRAPIGRETAPCLIKARFPHLTAATFPAQ